MPRSRNLRRGFGGTGVLPLATDPIPLSRLAGAKDVDIERGRKLRNGKEKFDSRYSIYFTVHVKCSKQLVPSLLMGSE